MWTWGSSRAHYKITVSFFVSSTDSSFPNILTHLPFSFPILYILIESFFWSITVFNCFLSKTKSAMVTFISIHPRMWRGSLKVYFYVRSDFYSSPHTTGKDLREKGRTPTRFLFIPVHDVEAILRPYPHFRSRISIHPRARRGSFCAVYTSTDFDNDFYSSPYVTGKANICILHKYLPLCWRTSSYFVLFVYI